MSTTLLDVEAVRARYAALDRRLAFFDGPGGTQCPNEVIDAIARYLREDNANVGAPYETSVRTVELIERARAAAGRFLACHPDEVAFGQSMTSLNFLLTRALGRRLQPGDEILCTKLDHDANVSPWLALEQDLGVVVRFAEVHEDLSLDFADLEAQLTERTRVVAFPVASNAVGTMPDVTRIVELAHGVGALTWADAVHYGPHGPTDVAAWDVDVLLCSPYKFFGPHMGLAFGKRDLLESLRPYKVRPAANEPVGHRFEHGTQQHELLAGFVAAVEYVESLGWEAIVAHETELGQRFLDGLPDAVDLYGLRTMAGRVPTFAFNVPGRSSEDVARELAAREIAVWHGDYYAVEIMKQLGLEGTGAVRAGLVHYNTAAEVDRLLTALDELC
ncbi:MAG TPA: cysteine desulfurase-like protein [Gaiellaceae bacterium]|nr:cysteine desulfurase-like protein [Gaiellaceae bacterium]